jgi:large subunit ribosomal protein L35
VITRKFSLLTLKSPAIQVPNQSLIKPNISALALNAVKPNVTQVRTVIKFSLGKGKRKSVKCVLKRFKRLHFGIWIRTRSARFKRLWKKTQSRRYRKRQHVFCNATQSTLLDKMVTSYWRRPRHYINDPYEPYYTRENYWATRKKPIEWDL